MSLRALILDDPPIGYLDDLKRRFPTVAFDAITTYAELAPAVARHKPDVALVNKVEKVPFPRAALLGCPTLRWVQAASAGIDHLVPWDPAKVSVTNVSGIHGELMTQYALGVIFGHNLRLFECQERMRRKFWQHFDGRVVSGRTLVIVGLGRIGKDIGRAAKSFGMRVIGVRARPEPCAEADAVWGIDRLHAALAEADYAVIVVPKTPQTVDLIDAAALKALKRGAVFIHVARGGIVNEPALIAAVKDGTVAFAAVDVFETEPLPADSPFWTTPNVLVTPHSSSDVEGWHELVAGVFAENLSSWLAGRPLRNLTDPSRGY
jgi:phosphoglycerate dehydrogenase-like enzyme